MNIIFAFIGIYCGESDSKYSYIWICTTIVASCILIYLTIRMILKYLREKHIREEQQEMKIIENKTTKDDFACIKNNLCEIRQKLDEIKSLVESRF